MPRYINLHTRCSIDHGITYTLKALDRDDLDRQLVKSPSCSITIPEYQLTIPPGKGQLTTVEGVLRDTVLDLRSDQPLRKIQDEKTYAAIQSLIDPLAEIIADTDSEGERLSDATRQKNRRARLEKPIRPFTLILDDPSGDSFLEFKDSMSDARWTMRQYNRTLEQNQQLGLASADTSGSPSDDLASGPVEPKQSVDETKGTSLTANEEIFVFPGVCSSCGRALNTMMKKVVIPYFKVILSRRWIYETAMLIYILVRILSSCQLTAMHADIEITKSSQVERSLIKARKLP